MSWRKVGNPWSWGEKEMAGSRPMQVWIIIFNNCFYDSYSLRQIICCY